MLTRRNEAHHAILGVTLTVWIFTMLFRFMSLACSFRVENQCSFDSVMFHQVGFEPEPSHTVKPFQSKRFTWDDPSAPHKLVLRVQRHWWGFGPPTPITEGSDGGANSGAPPGDEKTDDDGGGGGGGGGSKQQGVIDSHWKPVHDALAVPYADDFVHSVEVSAIAAHCDRSMRCLISRSALPVPPGLGTWHVCSLAHARTPGHAHTRTHRWWWT